ncbi:hypothetical protein [Streptomyces sp. NPDC001978]|uniref:hypothetical protein n=1 Tax=Streptomyces sp. NPDC001978 TaxID=3364627 RepID=UPI00368A5686
MTDVTEPESLVQMLDGASYRNDTYALLCDRPGWLAPSGYRVFSTCEDALAALRDPDTFGQERVPYPNFHAIDSLLHTRTRRLVAKVFTAQSVHLLPAARSDHRDRRADRRRHRRPQGGPTSSPMSRCDSRSA